jgi:hypothetical protein
MARYNVELLYHDTAKIMHLEDLESGYEIAGIRVNRDTR